MTIFIISSSEENNTYFDDIYQLKDSSHSEQFFDSELEEDEETTYVCYCLNKYRCVCNKTINIFSKHKGIILKLIDKINDLHERIDYLIKLKDKFNTKINHTTSELPPYNFSKIVSKFKTEKQKITGPTSIN